MELGKRILQARQEARLSQRQLCGDVITRNMLSQIEHGTARPSMDTLRYLAGRLNKPISYFLNEDGAVSPNHGAMNRARQAYDAGDFGSALEALAQFQLPDEVFDRERQLLQILCLLGSAEHALEAGREIYARELLEKAGRLGESCTYDAEALERRRLLLLGRGKQTSLAGIARQLPSMDEELYLRTLAALEEGDAHRAAALLDAMEDRETPKWHLLRGRSELLLSDYAAAADHLRRAEPVYPEETVPLLERCYRELGDYQQAYYYACLQKK